MSRIPTAPEQLLHQLDWAVVRRLDGLLHGDYRTRLYGTGVDFADLREYEPGDDVRHIDWNVTARMSSPFVRQFVAEREVSAWLVLDRSSSMTFGPEERGKDVVLAELAGVVARLFSRNGNRVGAILHDNAVERLIEPRTGRNQVLRIVRALSEPLPASGAATDLAHVLRIAGDVIQRRSLIFVISDFISSPGWDRPLGQLARRHEVVAVRVLDPREVELPDAGLIVVEDAETGAQMFVDTSDPAFRRRFKEAAAAREEELQASVRRAGVALYPIATDEDLVGALLRMVRTHRYRRA